MPQGLRILLLALATLACAPAPPEGMEVDIFAEDALIVWDAKTKTEHFIRRGSFRGKDIGKLGERGFGFLVPTPTQPTLAEVSERLFADLEHAIRPQRVQKRRIDVLWSLLWLGVGMTLSRSADEAAIAAADPEVEVLGQQRVAGLDAAILKASDTEALAKWLRDHGYAYRDALRAWLQRYVEAGWVITAFKLAADAGQPGLDTAALRMSFKTERPFYPYREPEDQRRADAPSRSLRVFVIANERMTGAVGKTAWKSELLHAAPHDGTLPKDTSVGDGGAWLHAFIDRQSPRPGTEELWFERDSDQSEKRVPPIVTYRSTPVPLFLDVILGVGLVVWWRRRNKLRGEEPSGG